MKVVVASADEMMVYRFRRSIFVPLGVIYLTHDRGGSVDCATPPAMPCPLAKVAVWSIPRGSVFLARLDNE